MIWCDEDANEPDDSPEVNVWSGRGILLFMKMIIIAESLRALRLSFRLSLSPSFWPI